MREKLIQLLLGGGDPKDPAVRQHCGSRTGAVGIGLNFLLFLGKLGAGLLTGSVAIAADAVNNLSDAASSGMTLVGFRMAGREADGRHPFGHGRMEYVAGLVVALAILLMGVEVGKSALTALFHPEDTLFSGLAVGVLCASIGVKCFLFWLDREVGRTIGSSAVEAAAADSLADMASTGVVLLSMLAGHLFHLRLDGPAGLLVAVFILKTGWDAAADTLDPLLGRPMDPALAGEVEELASHYPDILGIHDLVYHDYGPGRAMLTFHAEVPAELDVLTVHRQIDLLERALWVRRGVEAVIHMDPVLRDPETERLRRRAACFARELDPALTVHDVQLVRENGERFLRLEAAIPYGMDLDPEEVRRFLTEKLSGAAPDITPSVRVERSYVEEDPR